MLVRDYMTPDPKTLRPANTLQDAAFLFYKYKIKGAVVINEQKAVCGLITTSHIIKAVLNQIPFTAPVSALMSTNVITVSPENTIEEAWEIPVSQLPVVTAGNELVGMLTRRDFLSAYYNQMRRNGDEVKAILRSAHSGIVVVDSLGIVLRMNQMAADLFGVSLDDALGADGLELFHALRLKKVLLTGESEIGCQFTVNNKTLFCNTSPIREGTKVVGAIAVIQNVSEIEHIVKQLSEAQHNYEALENVFENALQGIVAIDTDGNVTQINKAFEDLFGLSRGEVIGVSLQEALEGSKLHRVLSSGISEAGEVFIYHGCKYIVNRLPIFKDGKVIGALGEAIYGDISVLNQLLQRLHVLEPPNAVSSQSAAVRTAHYTFEDIRGRSRSMMQVRNLAAKAAASDSSVLITGESGTGKELFAQAVHNASRRCAGPFVCINCAAIPEELFESELFGYEEGAFTGARKGGKKGKFEEADGGTLFLDEIGDMPLVMQAKLLRVLQDGKFEHIGSTKVQSSNVRIIAATNKPIEEMVRAKTFREDLFYRLNVIQLHLPPLRERMEDFDELPGYLLRDICRRLNLPAKTLQPEAIDILRHCRWPGNVRELVNIIEKLAVTTNAIEIRPHHLAAVLNASGAMHRPRSDAPASETETAEAAERRRIEEALVCAKGNKSLAAHMLGVHRSTLYEKIKKYQLASDYEVSDQTM